MGEWGRWVKRRTDIGKDVLEKIEVNLSSRISDMEALRQNGLLISGV